mgnify:CR=1 FL=1
MMITAMENAALNAIRGFLEPEESAVGTAVNIRHSAATPVGHVVTAEAEVTGVEVSDAPAPDDPASCAND